MKTSTKVLILYSSLMTVLIFGVGVLNFQVYWRTESQVQTFFKQLSESGDSLRVVCIEDDSTRYAGRYCTGIGQNSPNNSWPKMVILSRPPLDVSIREDTLYVRNQKRVEIYLPKVAKVIENGRENPVPYHVVRYWD